MTELPVKTVDAPPAVKPAGISELYVGAKVHDEAVLTPTLLKITVVPPVLPPPAPYMERVVYEVPPPARGQPAPKVFGAYVRGFVTLNA